MLQFYLLIYQDLQIIQKQFNLNKSGVCLKIYLLNLINYVWFRNALKYIQLVIAMLLLDLVIFKIKIEHKMS